MSLLETYGTLATAEEVGLETVPLDRSRGLSLHSLVGPRLVSPTSDEETGLKPVTSGGANKYGTWTGVYFPCVANILGAFIFLRQPWMTGHAGFVMSEGIVIISALTTTLTVLSISALATNGKIRAGGCYYMISRTLGPEFGGAVGISFYLATTVGISMYIMGTVETIREGSGLKDTGLGPIERQTFGWILSLAGALIVYIGVDYVSKAIPFFSAATIAGILAMWMGMFSNWQDNESNCEEAGRCLHNIWTDNQLSKNMWPEYRDGQTLRTVLAIFFPSVTGITAGANLSAVLKDPSVAIPRGTLHAIAHTTFAYLVNVLFFAMAVDRELLRDLNTVVASYVAFPVPVFVDIAIIASTAGAALACFAGAPRLLQAIVYDRILPVLNPLVEDPEKDPRKTLLVTLIICLLCCLPGELNFITPVATVFYLTFYAFCNTACFLLLVLRSPNFRPDSKLARWWTALAGIILSIAMMILISPIAAIATTIASGLVYFYITTYGEHPDWGDALFDLRWYTTRKSLLELNNYGPIHQKNWRPNIMLLAKIKFADGKPVIEDPDMVAFMSQLRHARGIQVIGTVLPHSMDEGLPDYDPVEAWEAISAYCGSQKLKCFSEVVTDTVEHGMLSLLQASGLGKFRPNIIVCGWYSNWRTKESSRSGFVKLLTACEMLHKALIVIRNDEVKYPAVKVDPGKTIDIWWSQHGGGLLLLIPYLLSQHRNWQGTRLRCFTLVTRGAEHDMTQVKRIFKELRITAEIVPVEFEGSAWVFSYPRWSVRQQLRDASKQLHTAGLSREDDVSPAKRVDFEINPLSRVGEDAESDGDDEEEEGRTGPSCSSPVDDRQESVLQRLNALIKRHVADTALVILNLPKFDVRACRGLPLDADVSNYMRRVDSLTTGLPPTLLVRDGGRDLTTAVVEGA
ncbi:Cation-chloride cotransporter 2 [Diplonema papillatum]|nr:Cation-chloride cotransporter 2 [Diplonema papillatum]